MGWRIIKNSSYLMEFQTFYNFMIPFIVKHQHLIACLSVEFEVNWISPLLGEYEIYCLDDPNFDWSVAWVSYFSFVSQFSFWFQKYSRQILNDFRFYFLMANQVIAIFLLKKQVRQQIKVNSHKQMKIWLLSWL